MALVRTQISLDAGMHRRAKRRAAELGISLSELTRRALERELDGEGEPRGDIGLIFGLGASDEPTDIAAHKDEYIAEATRNEYLRKVGRLPKD